MASELQRDLQDLDDLSERAESAHEIGGDQSQRGNLLFEEPSQMVSSQL